MNDIPADQPGRQFITIYVPIFREKLEKLERRGRGFCAEAVKLRRTLALIDNTRNCSRLGRENYPLSVAAE